MSETTALGRVLGNRYRLDSLLGQGGMSSVYRATDPNLRRAVAVKLIHSHLTNDPQFVRRFEVEASAVAQLHHPNIIQVYDFNRDGNTYYMVLELVAGESLDRRLRRLAADGQRLPPAQAARITAEIADALDYAHGQGLIHRDIKPANIMLTDRGHAVLMDFGVAKIIGATEHTATGALVGTAFYISPEQVRGEPPTAWSDIYALGASLFEMLAGRPPFTGDSAMSVMLKHVNEPVPDLRQIAPDTPPALVLVVETALAKDPRRRFPSAGDMAAALQQAADGLAAARTGAKAAGVSGAGPGAATVIDDEPPDPSAASPAAPPVVPTPALAAAAPATRAAPAGPASHPAATPASAAGAASAVAPPVHRGGRPLWLLGGSVAVLLCLALGGTAALTGIMALPFLVAAPTARPSSPGAVLFQDDFTTPAGQWTTDSQSRGSAAYGQGEFVMHLTNANDNHWSIAGIGALSNLHAEVTAANTSRATDAAFGIICDYHDDRNFYLLGINDNGYYAIIRLLNGTATNLTDDQGSWVQSSRIVTGATSYRVGADCGGDGTLALYADGQTIATARDSTFKSGSIGLFLWSFYVGPAEVHFRSLVVTALP